MLRAIPNNGHTAGNAEEEEEFVHRQQPVGIYGWRKRCLYAFILFLMVLTILNLALIVWILRVLNFSVHGMGKLRITENGIRLEGEAEFLDSLYTNKIQSVQSMNINELLLVNYEKGGNNRLVAQCNEFEVIDHKGQTRFKVWDRGVAMEMDEVYYSGSSTVTFNGSVETPNIRGPRAKPLKIEAPTTSIHMHAEKEIRIYAPAADMTISTLKEIQMRSKDSIILDSSKLYIKNLKVSTVSGKQSRPGYQLCMCSTGLLFIADADKECQGTREICS
uniref:Delta-sarcoglycan n=1 Tax=Magallana gigas TaxID=29159 RepID=K1Q8H7_MAGGI